MTAPPNIRTRANPRWRLRLLLALVALVAFAYLGWKFRKEMPRLLEAKPLGIALIVATFLPMRLLTSEVQRIGLRALGHVISTYESFMVSMINAYGNLLLPRAGLGLPAVYLKLKHAIPVADFATVQVLPLTALQIATIGVTGVASLGAMRLLDRRPVDVRLLALFAAVAAGSVVGTLARFKVPDSWQNRPAQFLRRLSESWRRLGRSGHVASTSVALHVGTLLLRGLRLQIAFWSIGQPVGYLPAFVASLLADIAFFISITPAALGFREGAVALAAGMLGATTEVCVAAVFLDRIVYSIVIILTAQVGMWHLMRPVFHHTPTPLEVAAPVE